MRKSNVISLKECYQILQIDKNAALEDVKKAYRKRAFELHPDLNPDTPDAGTQFKILNEAYVTLSQILEAEQARQGKSWTRNNTNAKEKEKAKKEQAKQYEKKQAEKQREEEQAQRQTYTRQHAKQSKQENTETNKESAYTGYTGTTEQNAQQSATQKENAQKAASSAYAKEDVLRDLLNDPFARRVFEDIYSEVNKQAENNTESKTANEAETISPPPKQSTSKPAHTFVDIRENKAGLHMANSFSNKILGWFKHQIDEAQTIKMPASSLFVGARIRLQIRRGLSDELSTVEIVLPKEFVVGKPLRLRGLGKKVGKWQGDLYLTIESK